MLFPKFAPAGSQIRMALLSSACLWGPLAFSSADWPGLLGPTRDGFAAANPELADHSKSAPKMLWEIDAGQGYAGAAIEQDKVVMFFREGANDVIQSVSLAQGEPIWKTTFPATYRQGIDSDTGPRCVPQIANGKVLAYSAAGTLHCVNLADGKKLWSRELRKEYGAEDGYFGAGSTPCRSTTWSSSMWVVAKRAVSLLFRLLMARPNGKPPMPTRVTLHRSFGTNRSLCRHVWKPLDSIPPTDPSCGRFLSDNAARQSMRPHRSSLKKTICF